MLDAFSPGAPAGAFAVVCGGLAVAGSIIRKSFLQHDYDRAIALRDQQLRASGIAPVVEPAVYKNVVTPQEAQQLAQKQQEHPAKAEKEAADVAIR